MTSIKVFVEMGKKKTFAGAVDWPGWCRSDRDEKMALVVESSGHRDILFAG